LSKTIEAEKHKNIGKVKPQTEEQRRVRRTEVERDTMKRESDFEATLSSSCKPCNSVKNILYIGIVGPRKMDDRPSTPGNTSADGRTARFKLYEGFLTSLAQADADVDAFTMASKLRPRLMLYNLLPD
jgi:hypothetical protein